MTDRRAQLDIPPAMAEFAKAHGATKDYDGRWFANEPLSNELESFRFKVVRQREYEFEPRCPKCGQNMVKRTSRSTGNQFWGCSAYPACRTIREIDHAAAGDVSDLALKGMQQAWSSPNQSQAPHGSQPRQKVDKNYLQRRWVKIVGKAAASLGGEEQAQRWLEAPHPKLQGKRPIDLLGTPSGCDAVEHVL